MKPEDTEWYGLGVMVWDGGTGWGHSGTIEGGRAVVEHDADGTTWAITVSGTNRAWARTCAPRCVPLSTPYRATARRRRPPCAGLSPTDAGRTDSPPGALVLDQAVATVHHQHLAVHVRRAG